MVATPKQQGSVIPNRNDLRPETLTCIKRGIKDSAEMRKDIARRLKIDPQHPTFVNNHAWSLVDLQGQDLIVKIADGFSGPMSSVEY